MIRLLSMAAAALMMFLALAPAEATERQPIHQLRIYDIFDANKAAFHERFRDHGLPIMKRHGFTVLAMWETRKDDRPQLVYLLQWPDEATMQARWKSFLADPEWIEIKRVTGARHGRMVGEIESRVLTTLPYSPSLEHSGI